MAMKEYSTFPKYLKLESCHQIVLCHIQDTRWGESGLTVLQRCSQCILQLQLSGLIKWLMISNWWIFNSMSSMVILCQVVKELHTLYVYIYIFCTQSHDIKYCCLILITFKQIYRPIHGTLSGTTTPGQSGPGSNGNEEVFYTSQISRTRTLPPDSVYCHTQDILVFFLGGGVTRGLTPQQEIH